ncbi:hypothetical protein D3C81_930090 [compost metagenome]
MAALQERREQPQHLKAAAAVDDADIEQAVLRLGLRRDQQSASIARQIADRCQPNVLEGVLLPVADDDRAPRLVRHQGVQDADEIGKPPGTQGVAERLVPAGVDVDRHLGIEAAGDRGQRRGLAIFRAGADQQIGAGLRAAQDDIQGGFGLFRHAEAARRVIAGAGRNDAERYAPGPQRRQDAVNRAVAADNDAGGPALPAAQRLLHFPPGSFGASRTESLIFHLPFLKTFFGAPPGALPHSPAGAGIDDEQIHSRSPRSIIFRCHSCTIVPKTEPE